MPSALLKAKDAASVRSDSTVAAASLSASLSLPVVYRKVLRYDSKI